MAAAEPPSSGEVHDPCAGSQRDGGEAEVFYRESGFFRLLGPEELRGAQGEEPGGSAGAAEDERGAGGRVCEQRIRRDPGEVRANSRNLPSRAVGGGGWREKRRGRRRAEDKDETILMAVAGYFKDSALLSTPLLCRFATSIACDL